MKKFYKKFNWENLVLCMFGCIVALVAMAVIMSPTGCKSPAIKQKTEVAPEKTPEECPKKHCEECIKKQNKQPLKEAYKYNSKGNLHRVIPKSSFDYNDIIYLKDYRTGHCFALHSDFGGLGAVSCSTVKNLIKNAK